MAKSESAKQRVLNSKTGVGVGMALVGLVAAGSVVRSKQQKSRGQHAADKGKHDDEE